MQVFVYKGSEALSRQLRCAIGIFYGRWYSPVPNKVQLTVLVGKPITVEKVQDPDSKQVQNAFLLQRSKRSAMFLLMMQSYRSWLPNLQKITALTCDASADLIMLCR